MEQSVLEQFQLYYEFTVKEKGTKREKKAKVRRRAEVS